MHKIATILVSIVILSLSGRAQEARSIFGQTQGTTYNIKYYDEQNRDFTDTIDKILKDFSHLFSSYDTTSIVSQINRNQTPPLDTLFKTCFRRSQQISQQTNGAFDITVAPLVSVWGFGPNRKTSVNAHIIDSLLPIVGYQKISLRNDSIIKQDQRITILFNAIAQGYSVDVVSDFLQSQNIQNYFVEIGGEVIVHGHKPKGEGWIIGIEKPTDNQSDNLNEITQMLQLQNRAISTSGNYRNFYVENGIKYSHTINPHTGYPSQNTLLSASILASTCADADAYATACMVMGIDIAIQFLKQHPELDALLIYTNKAGKYCNYTTKGFKKNVAKAKR